MDVTLAALIFGLAALVVAAVLLWRAQSRGDHAEASWSFGEIFTSSVTLSPGDNTTARGALENAARQRGSDPASVSDTVSRETTRLVRVLWVDDWPDNNLYETVALESVGRFVTKTTSTDSALAYLAEMDFALLITDLGRGEDPEAGAHLIRNLRASGQSTPIVVYTVDAQSRREALLGIGADAVVDRPDELVGEVDRLIDTTTG